MRPRLLAVTLCAVLVGCGGGSSSSSPASTPTGSISGGAVAVGVITGFSSVFVDGVRYEVESDTQVDLDGTVTAGSDQALRIGMKVSLQSQEVDGVRVASQITYDKDLSGPAVNVMPNAENPAIGTFEILGQQVVVDSGTVFDDEWPDRNSDGESDLNDLVGTADPVIVEVSGFLTEDGFLATRLEVETDSDDGLYELEGVVDAVDVSGDTFTINQLTVQVDGATEFVAPRVFDDSLVGQYLEVEVEERTGEANLFAVIVAAEDESDFDDDEAPEGELEVRGVLSAVNTELSPAEIVIGGSTLQVSDTASLAGLVGKIVRIEGEFNAEGVLVIDSVEARLEVNVELEDTVAVVDLVEGTVTTRLGVVITPDGVSRVRDDDEGGHHLTPTEWLERVMPGDYLEAEGALQEGSVTWLNLEVEGVDAGEEPGDEACELRGPVANKLL